MSRRPLPLPRPTGRGADQRGQATILIVGFAVLLAMVAGFVTDATAAYLQRQGLDTLADGAALRGADLGATGREVYEGGVPAGDLELVAAQARAAVGDYLRTSGAYTHYPGLSYAIRIDPTGHRVEVRLSAPMHLPLSVPGSPQDTTVGATGTAVVTVED